MTMSRWLSSYQVLSNNLEGSIYFSFECLAKQAEFESEQQRL